MSLMEFVSALERISEDPRPLGVILYFRGLSASTADLQSMRDAIIASARQGQACPEFCARLPHDGILRRERL